MRGALLAAGVVVFVLQIWVAVPRVSVVLVAVALMAASVVHVPPREAAQMSEDTDVDTFRLPWDDPGRDRAAGIVRDAYLRGDYGQDLEAVEELEERMGLVFSGGSLTHPWSLSECPTIARRLTNYNNPPARVAEDTLLAAWRTPHAGLGTKLKVTLDGISREGGRPSRLRSPSSVEQGSTDHPCWCDHD